MVQEKLGKMLSLRHGPRRWHRDATSRHSPSSADATARPGQVQRRECGVGWGLWGSQQDSPIYCQLHQLPHSTAFEHGLLGGARVEHSVEPEGGIVPGRAHLGTGMVAAQGEPQPLLDPTWKVTLTWMVPSPRLCTTRRSPRCVSVQVSGRTLIV